MGCWQKGVGEEVSDHRPIVGYDPNTGKAVYGYDPSSGAPVFADSTPTSANAPEHVVAPSTGPKGLATFQTQLEHAAAQGNPKAKQVLEAMQKFSEGQKQFNNAAPMIGAVVASGGLAGIPAVLAAAGGGAAGQLYADAPKDMTAAERATHAAKTGVIQGALQIPGEILAAAGPKLQQGARDLWNRVAKVTEPVAKTTQTMRAGGTLAQAKNEIADTVLSQGAGTIRAKNLDAMKSALGDMDDKIDSIISGSKAFVDRGKIEDALIQKSVNIGSGSIAQEAQQSALNKAFDLLSSRPKRMTVQEAQSLKRSIYAAYEKTFAADATQAASAMADKTTASALRSEIAAAEPAVAPINAAMSRQIPAVKAMDKALSRTGNRDSLGLSQMLAGMVPNPLTLAGALLNHPKIGSFTAQQVYNAAKLLPKSGRTVNNIIRAAQMMASDEGGQ